MKLSQALLVSVALHAVLGLSLFAFEPSPKLDASSKLASDTPKPLPTPAPAPVKAGLVNEKLIKQAVERQRSAEKKRARKIKQEQQRLAELKRQANKAKQRASKLAKERDQAKQALQSAHTARKQAQRERDKVLAEKQQLEQAKARLAKEKARLETLKAQAKKEHQAWEAKREARKKKELQLQQEAAAKAQQAAADKLQRQRRQSWLQNEFNRYVSEFKDAIESNRILSSAFPKGAFCKIRIRLMPDGSILDLRITKSSGIAAYDSMSATAVHKAAPFAMPQDPELQKQLRDIELGFPNGPPTLGQTT